MNRLLQYATPVVLGLVVLALWEFIVRRFDIPPYVLPAPSAIATAFADNFSSLMSSLWTTLQVTLEAFALAVAGGVALAILFSQNKAIEERALPLCRRAAGDARRRHRAAHSDLGGIRTHQSGARHHRLHRGVLPDPFEHDAGLALDRSQSDRSLSPVRCLALADSREAAIAVCVALSFGRDEDLGRSRAHRRCRRGIRRRVGNGIGIGVAHRRGRQSSGDREDVRGGWALLAALGIAIFSILTLVEWALLHRWHESALKKEG